MDDGAFGSGEEQGGLSVRARWLDGGSGELSRPSGGPVLKEARARRGQAPSGLALLHLDRPGLDRAGPLHLGGGRGALLQLHSSQAGLFVHALLGLWTDEREQRQSASCRNTGLDSLLPLSPACSGATEKSSPETPVLRWKDRTEKEFPWEGQWRGLLPPLPRVLRAVRRRGRKRPGPLGSIPGCSPWASAGAAHPRPTREIFLNQCTPCPEGKRPHIDPSATHESEPLNV